MDMEKVLERVVRLETMNDEHEKTLENLRFDYHDALNKLGENMEKIAGKIDAIEKQTSGYRMMVVGGIAVFTMMVAAINWVAGILNMDISNFLNKIK